MPTEANPILRPLRPTDVPAALRLSVEAGWNQTADDWSMLIDLSPQTCMGIEQDRELVSTGTLFCYGPRLGWIGMVLTKISHRGRGFARRILTRALELTHQLGIQTVKLDATDQGLPLYEKLGFRAEQPVERWIREGQPGVQLTSATSPVASAWFEADAQAFGTDRSVLLKALAQRRSPFTADSAYALTRAGRENNFFGPCVAPSAGVARSLVEQALASGKNGGWIWDLFPRNTAALQLARDLGFAPQRHLTRMSRGKDLRGEDELIFALAGFELG